MNIIKEWIRKIRLHNSLVIECDNLRLKCGKYKEAINRTIALQDIKYIKEVLDN